MQVIRGEEGDEEGDEDEDERSQLKVQALFSPISFLITRTRTSTTHTHSEVSELPTLLPTLCCLPLPYRSTGDVLFMGCFARFPRCQRSKGKSPSEEEGAEGEMGIPLPFLPLPD